MNEETRNKALAITYKLERDIISVHQTLDEALTGLKEVIDKLIKDLEPKVDPKDPEELDRFKNADYDIENTVIESEIEQMREERDNI